MPRFLRHPAGRYTFAVVGMLLATYVRIPLEPWLGDRIPFGPQLMFLLLTVGMVGTGPGLAALGVGLVATIVLVVAPTGLPFVSNVADLLAIGVYGLVGVGAIALFDRTRKEHELAKQRAAENADLAARLREASRQKDEYLALLAHELRNPLAPIRTGLDLLDRSPSESVAVNVRERLRRQVRQLVRIVDDLLDVSRIVRGKLRLEREPLDLRETVDVSLDTIRPALDDRGHNVQWERPDREIYVDGDRVRLVQIVTNLLSNAGKYTQDGGTVRIALEPTPIGRVTLTVTDNGFGIPADRLGSIFRMFARAHAPKTRDHGGLGLGLAIVNRLVDLHGGRVWAESDGEGMGSRFVVELPATNPPERVTDIVDAEQAAAHNARATEQVTLLADSSIHDSYPDLDVRDTVILEPTIRVLIVDDNTDAAQTLGTLIALEGCTTRIEQDGPSALDCLDAFRPHVVLLDIGMPGMNGYEVAKAIRKRYRNDRPRLIAVTGWGGSEDRRRSAEAGFDHHFVKPVATADLLNEIRPRSGGARATV